MSEGIYVYISSIAVICYLFMLIIFVNSEKNKVINSFLLLLVSMIFWTGGSLLMRMQVLPSYEFWYHVSFGGLLLIIYSYFRFIISFIGVEKNNISRIYFLLLMSCFLINIPSGILLHWPTIINVSGRDMMIYEEISGYIVILFFIAAIITFHMIYVLFINFRRNNKMIKQTMPVIMGIVALYIGNLAVLLPVFKGFPIDIVAGVINAALLMYALVKKQLFKVKLIASEYVGYILCVGLGFVVFYNILPYINMMIDKKPDINPDYYLSIYLVSFVIIVSALFYFWKKVVANIFIKDEENQNEILKKFSSDVSKSLNLKIIFESTVKAIVDSTGTKNIYIGIPEYMSNNYILRYSDQSLEDASVVLRKDSPIIKWIQKNEDYLPMEEFVHSVEYKTMDKSEKLQITRLGIDYCIGMKENSQLIGFIFFSDYGRKKKLRKQDISIIASIGSIASIAIKNAHTYEKAYLEARTDELTGVLNRRRFYELIQEQFETNKDGSLALIIISLDDFKLFNQLYGIKQGDDTLKRVADILWASIGNRGNVARYSGKEFAIILPGFDVESSMELAESIRDQISGIGKTIENNRQKSITISVGISIAAKGTRTLKELLDNADQAVYHVKRKGKNGIKVFDTFDSSTKYIDEELANTNVYDEYKSTIYALTAAIDAKDHYTFSHSDNVASYAVALAVELKLNKDIIENIRQAALLHDIGKISIPESILNKPGKLTQDEFLIMQGHVEASIDIIRHLPSLDYVIPAVLGHHERYDGFGYPRRISGEAIPYSARILCIVDAFDAMISKRCYKSKMPVDCALNILSEEAGRQFDPKLVKVFIALVESGKITIPFEEKESLSIIS